MCSGGVIHFFTIKALMLLFHNTWPENIILLWYEMIELFHKRAQLHVLQ